MLILANEMLDFFNKTKAEELTPNFPTFWCARARMFFLFGALSPLFLDAASLLRIGSSPAYSGAF